MIMIWEQLRIDVLFIIIISIHLIFFKENNMSAKVKMIH
jgi:hypothetical protein